MRFNLKPSIEHPGFWVLADSENGIVCIFEEHRFNDTQKFTILEDVDPSAVNLPRIVNEMAEWLRENHYELAMPVPWRQWIGTAIRTRREEKGYSIRQLADLCGMSKNNIVRIEQGKYNYTIDALNIVAETLGLGIELKKER